MDEPRREPRHRKGLVLTSCKGRIVVLKLIKKGGIECEFLSLHHDLLLVKCSLRSNIGN